MKKKNGKMSAKKAVLVCLIAVLILACGAILIFNLYFVNIGGRTFSRTVTAIDLSGSGIEDISPLENLTGLEEADVSGGTVKTLPLLKKCPSLARLRVSGSDFDAGECAAFYAAHPNAELECGVVIAGNRYSSLAQSVQLPDGMNDSDIRLLAVLRRLRSLDLTGSDVSDTTFDYLMGNLPGCDIVRKLTFDGAEYLSNTGKVTLSPEFFDNGATEIERIRYFTSLSEINAAACTDTQALTELKNRFPQYLVRWKVSVLGVKTDTAAQELDLNRKKYSLNEFLAEFEKKIPMFHDLKKVYMLSCGLKNNDMDVLIERFPGIKFVWYVTAGPYKIRSDAVSFSTLIGRRSEGRKLSENNMQPLFKYCTDLVSLDLGHCRFKDLSQLANLKNLRGLILTDNFVEDITPLAQLEKLEFIEMNDNDVVSVEPLRNLKNLKMVNLYESKRITDLSPLYHHENLEMVIFDMDVPADEQKRLADSNPGCKTFFKVDLDGVRTTNAAWRNAPLRVKFKQTFRTWRNVAGYDEEKGKFIFDYETGRYTI